MTRVNSLRHLREVGQIPSREFHFSVDLKFRIKVSNAEELVFGLAQAVPVPAPRQQVFAEFRRHNLIKPQVLQAYLSQLTGATATLTRSGDDVIYITCSWADTR